MKPTFMPDYEPNRDNTFALPIGHKIRLGDWFVLPTIMPDDFHPVTSPECGLVIHSKIHGMYRRFDPDAYAEQEYDRACARKETIT